MSKNEGKVFEQDFAKSMPNYALLYRLPDSAQVFGGSNNLRFSRKNPFDFLLWDSKRKTLYALELKTVSKQSISFERDKNEKGEIHCHQVQGLNTWNKYDGITCGFILEFRGIATTVFLDIESYNTLVTQIDKKSFSYQDICVSGLPYFVIPQVIKKTHYSYDIETFLSRNDNN